MDQKNVSGPWIHYVVDSSCWNIYFFWVVYPFNIYFFSLPFHGIFFDRNGTEWCPGRVEASLRRCRRVVETLLVLFSSQHPVFGREGDVKCSVYWCDLWHSVFRSHLHRDPAAVDAQRVSLLWQNCNTHIAVKWHYCSLTARPTEGAVAPFRMETVPFKVKVFWLCRCRVLSVKYHHT